MTDVAINHCTSKSGVSKVLSLRCKDMKAPIQSFLIALHTVDEWICSQMGCSNHDASLQSNGMHCFENSVLADPCYHMKASPLLLKRRWLTVAPIEAWHDAVTSGACQKAGGW